MTWESGRDGSRSIAVIQTLKFSHDCSLIYAFASRWLLTPGLPGGEIGFCVPAASLFWITRSLVSIYFTLTRFKGFAGLTQWAVELLSHYCITKFDENGVLTSLTIQQAFRRCLMLLSSGFFLPGSAGIRDPTERDGRSVHQNFSKNDQDMICATAQTLLR